MKNWPKTRVLPSFPRERFPAIKVSFTRRAHRAMRVFIPRFLGAIAYLVVLTVVGTIGYLAIEGWPWREALYMTVITLTAVGFQEVRPPRTGRHGRPDVLTCVPSSVFF